MVPWARRSAAVFSGMQLGQLRGSGWRRSALLTVAEELTQRVLLLISGEPKPFLPGGIKAVAEVATRSGR